MGKLKHAPKEAEKAEYQPIKWDQTSGFSIEDDAQWTAAIGGRDPFQARERRNHEIQRLAHFHGKDYARRVQARVAEIFNDARQLAESRERFKRVDFAETKIVINREAA